MKVRALHRQTWYEGPRLDYRAAGKDVTVNVAGSSWSLSGVALAEPVTDLLSEFKEKKHGDNNVLDFGAGSWLRYVSCVRNMLPTRNVYAVEFDEAFHDQSANSKSQFKGDVTFWAPKYFAPRVRPKFDLILLVNVLNTMPEEDHRRELLTCLSRRLNPLGWLMVYQRKWVESENRDGALPYGDGWLTPQVNYPYYTYRAGTGAIWFNAQAAACGLKAVETKAEAKISSGNTFFRVWRKPFGKG
jgi:hypothetical protein